MLEEQLNLEKLEGSVINKKMFYFNSGFVIIYEIKMLKINDYFYVVSLYEDNSEVIWGADFFLFKALRNASESWKQLNNGDDTNNPFSKVLQKIKEEFQIEA